jgi:HSP20 family protein
MSNSVKKMPVHTDEKAQHPARTDFWHPLEKLRQQVDHLFEDFNRGTGLSPFSRGLFDVEPFWLPGMDQKDIEIRLANGNLIIKGEKKEEKEEKKKGYHLSERHYGSFERVFNLPKGVDSDKIEAQFSKGVLTLTLPKKPEALKAEKVVPIKAD